MDVKFDNIWNEILMFICIEENYDNIKYMIIKKIFFFWRNNVKYLLKLLDLFVKLIRWLYICFVFGFNFKRRVWCVYFYFSFWLLNL